MAGKRLTREEVEQAIDFIIDRLARRLFRSEICSETAEKFGVARTRADQLINLAQVELRRRHTEATGQDTRCLALEFYGSVIRDPNATMKDRINAQTRLDRLLGHDMPLKVEVSGDDQIDAFIAAQLGKASNDVDDLAS